MPKNKLCSRGHPGDKAVTVSKPSTAVELFVDIGVEVGPVCECFLLGSFDRRSSGSLGKLDCVVPCLSMCCLAYSSHPLSCDLFLEANSFNPLNQIYPNPPLVASILLGERGRVSAEFPPPGAWGWVDTLILHL
jgi:hypothetical protein